MDRRSAGAVLVLVLVMMSSPAICFVTSSKGLLHAGLSPAACGRSRLCAWDAGCHEGSVKEPACGVSR
jgi:hypothetical protein